MAFLSDTLVRKIEMAVGAENVRQNENMAQHTSFRIGGPADLFLTPDTPEALAAARRILREEGVDIILLGNGTNVLISDRGIRGAVIKPGGGMSGVSVSGRTVRAGGGASLARAAACALTAGLGGMEFAAGIPGSVGGACAMNAGAYGGEMKDILSDVQLLYEDDRVAEVPAAALHMAYRTSDILTGGSVVLGAVFTLHEEDPDKIRGRMEELREKRMEKQPLEMPSAGSTFKRPEGYFAGKLIMEADLAGYRVGGAEVSRKHCGFVVNAGGATAEDVRHLMCDVQKRVFDRFGVMLEPEVRMIGDFDDEGDWA